MPASIKHEPDASLRAVAAVLGVAWITAYRMVKRGELPSYRAGRAIRVPMVAIRDFRARRIAAGWTPYKKSRGENGGQAKD